jgi:hypothetical protein
MSPKNTSAEINNLKTSLKELRILAQKQPEEHLPKVAGVCNNLGNLLVDEGEFEEAGTLISEALILHMMLWVQDRDVYSERLGIVLNSVRELAGNAAFQQGNQWLTQLWQVVLYNLRSGCFPFCRELGGLFESLEQWELALEPYIFAELLLRERNPEQAAVARADADQLNAKLVSDPNELRQQIETRLSDFTSAPSPPEA